MLLGVETKSLTRHYDERGSFTEILRTNWKDLNSIKETKQTNLSIAYPGIIKAWHRHRKGQIDFFVCLKGMMKICIYSEKTKELDEIISVGENPQIVRIPGYYYHGFKVLGNTPAWLLYFVTNFYDYKNPDEENIPWDDKRIKPISINGNLFDVRVNHPWEWNRIPHR